MIQFFDATYQFFDTTYLANENISETMSAQYFWEPGPESVVSSCSNWGIPVRSVVSTPHTKVVAGAQGYLLVPRAAVDHLCGCSNTCTVLPYQHFPWFLSCLWLPTHPYFPPFLAAVNLWSICMLSTGIKKSPLGFRSVNSEQEHQWCTGSSVCIKCQCFLSKSLHLTFYQMVGTAFPCSFFSEASFCSFKSGLITGAEFASKIVLLGNKPLQSHLYNPSEFPNFYKVFLIKSLARGCSQLFGELSHFPPTAFYYREVVVSAHTLLSGVWKSFQISVEILDLK